MKLCLAGEGAISQKHVAALARIPDVEIASLAGQTNQSQRTIANNARAKRSPRTRGNSIT